MNCVIPTAFGLPRPTPWFKVGIFITYKVIFKDVYLVGCILFRFDDLSVYFFFNLIVGINNKNVTSWIIYHVKKVFLSK